MRVVQGLEVGALQGFGVEVYHHGLLRRDDGGRREGEALARLALGVRLRVWGLGLRVGGSGFRVQGQGSRVEGVGLGVETLLQLALASAPRGVTVSEVKFEKSGPVKSGSSRIASSKDTRESNVRVSATEKFACGFQGWDSVFFLFQGSGFGVYGLGVWA